MKNGAHVYATIDGQIAVADRELDSARTAHGFAKGDAVIVEGRTMFDSDGKPAAFIDMAQKNRKGTGFHEVWHALKRLALTEKERADIDSAFEKTAREKGIDVEEAQADAAIEWQRQREQGKGSTFGRLFQKLQDMYYKLQAYFTGVQNLHNVLTQNETGALWERRNENATFRSMFDSLMPSEMLGGSIAGGGNVFHQQGL